MPPVDTIKLSQKAKYQLITLKGRTGLRHWNDLCRWAFCLSLAEPSVPPAARIPADSNVEMTWQTFGGRYQAVYAALLRQRCQQDGFGTAPEVLARQLRLHLHRGIGYLVANKDIRFEGIAGLVSMAVAEKGDIQ